MDIDSNAASPAGSAPAGSPFASAHGSVPSHGPSRDAPSDDLHNLATQRNLALACYALHILGGPFTVGAASLAGLIINHLQRDHARGTVYYTHHRWMIGTCWLGAGLALLAGLVCLAFPSLTLLLFPLIGIYLMLRMVTGAINAIHGEPIKD